MANWLTLLKQYIGWQGAASLADKLTAARAGYLDNINNAQLLNIPNLSTLSAARIGYLDNINQAGLLQVTAARAGYLDNINNAQLLVVPNLSTLTAARIGYLDNINQAGLLQVTAARAAYLDELAAANIPTDVDGLKTSRDRQLFSMDFWSAPQEEVAIPAVGAAATLTLPTVTIADLPAGATVVRAIAMLKCRMIENTNVAANKLSGATVAGESQVIQVRDDTPGTWRDAIKFADDQFGMAASTREGGDVLIGDIDIAVEVDANDGYNFQYLLAAADVAALNLNDVAVGLRIWYSV